MATVELINKILHIFPFRMIQREDFNELEYQKSREAEFVNILTIFHKLTIGILGMITLSSLLSNNLNNQQIVRMLTGVIVILLINRLLKYYPRLTYIIEVFVHQPLLVIISSSKVMQLNKDSLTYHPCMNFQQLYNLFILINSPTSWYVKVTSFFLNQVLYIVIYSNEYGFRNASLGQSHVYVIFLGIFTGVFLSINEDYLRKEFQLRQNEKYQNQKFTNVLQLMQDSVLIFHKEHNDQQIVYANEAFYKLQNNLQTVYFSLQKQFGRDTEIKIQKQNQYNTLGDLFQNFKFRDEYDNNNIGQKSFQEFIEFERNDDSCHVNNFFFKLEPISMSIQVNVSHLRQEGQILMVFKEISAIKKLQSTKNKEKFTNIFINSTAHNIFTPINGLLGIAELIEREVTQVSQASQYVKLMKNCIYHLYYTTQNIIEHSRLRLKQQTNDVKEIYLKSLVQQVSRIFDQDAQKKNINYHLQLENEDIKFLIDQSKASLVFYNILSNAFKYTEQGFLNISAKIIDYSQIKDIQNSILNETLKKQLKDYENPSIQTKQEYLYISILDSGEGVYEINPDKLFNLFSSFKISDDNINQQGLGLGLSVSSQICNQLGGKLFVENSEVNIGSKFAFIIPVQTTHKEELQYIEQDDSNFRQNLQENQNVQLFLDQANTEMMHQSYLSQDFQISENERHNIDQINQFNFELNMVTHSNSYSNATKNLNFQKHNINQNTATYIDEQVQQNFQGSDYQYTSSLEQELIEADHENSIYISERNVVNSFQNIRLNSRIHSQNIKQQQNDEIEQYPEILIVDDTVFNVEIIRMILQDIFHLASDQAYSGKQALELVQNRVSVLQNNLQLHSAPQYKLILMDLNMAGLDGVQTTQIIRRDYSRFFNQDTFKIYAHTAIPESQFGDYKERGFNGFLPKPLDKQILKNILIELKLIK